MKKAGKILLILIAIAAVLLVYLIRKQAVPKNYENGETGGPLEEKYLAHGSYEVSFTSEKAMQDFQKYEIWYPSALTDSDTVWPVIVISNGTGIKASKAKQMFRHFASWGFIVIGTEEEYSWNGFSAEMSLTHLLRRNEDPDSIFYHHINTEAIGALGHSQGGVGAINAATEQAHGSYYRTIVAESPTAMDLADALEWSYAPSGITVPVLLLASTGSMDENTVIPLSSLQKIYDAVPDEVMKVMARHNNADHSNMLYCADGYVTAWFLYQLCGDAEAGTVFTENGELRQNSLYQDVQISAGS
jgi:hypothetical protein